MQKIVPSLWFDHVAAEAANFYAEAIPGTTVTATQYYPAEGLLDFQQEFAGKELTVEFEVEGYRFVAINAGPEFRVNPSVSFMLNFDPSRDDQAREHLDAAWAALSDGGSELMPLGDYEFSPHYGWIQDRFGVSWQLILTDPAGEPRPFVIPNLLFGGSAQNRAGEAMEYYASVFEGARTAVDPGSARSPPETRPCLLRHPELRPCILPRPRLGPPKCDMFHIRSEARVRDPEGVRVSGRRDDEWHDLTSAGTAGGGRRGR